MDAWVEKCTTARRNGRVQPIQTPIQAFLALSAQPGSDGSRGEGGWRSQFGTLQAGAGDLSKVTKA